MSAEVDTLEKEKVYNDIISKFAIKLKEVGIVKSIDDNNKPNLKYPREFRLYGNAPKSTLVEAEYIIGVRSYGSEKYFVIVRNSGRSLGKIEDSTKFEEVNPTIPFKNLPNNICVGYISANEKEGGYIGKDTLLEEFVESEYGKYIAVDKNYITFDNFLNELKQIPKPYKISIELIDSAENFVYIDDKIKNLEVNDGYVEIDKLRVDLNILLIKNLTLEDKDIFLNKEILRIKFSVGKLSDTYGKISLKITPKFIKRGSKFENFYKNIKGYTHIKLDAPKRAKIEYLLVKRRIIKNLLDDNAFIEEIKNIGIISEDSKWIKYSIDLDKIKETIKQNLPQGATLAGGPIQLDTNNFLLHYKKDARKTNNNCVFKIKQANGQIINLLLLDKYNLKEFKDKLSEAVKDLDQNDLDKVAIEARASYLYPFIVVDLNGTHIKYTNVKPEIGLAPDTPFLPAAPNFINDIKSSLEKAVHGYITKDITKEEANIERKAEVAKIIYRIYVAYNEDLEIQKNNKRKGTYMERILYAFINALNGEAKRLGGRNEPDALLEYKNTGLLYIFDTKNLKSSSLLKNITDKTKRYKYTFERYIDDMGKYNNGNTRDSYERIYFIYVLDKIDENKKQEIQKLIEDIKETLSSKDYKDKVSVEIKSFGDACQMLYFNDFQQKM